MPAKAKIAEEFVENEDLAEEPEAELDLPEPEIVEEEELDLEFEDAILVEDLDPNEELWPGGPTAGMIVAWKEQYGDVFVSSFTPEIHIVWRTLNRFEYRNHIKKMEQLARTGQFTEAEASLMNEESLCEICVLFPQLTPDAMMGEMAGMASSLAGDVLEASGFVALEVRKL